MIWIGVFRGLAGIKFSGSPSKKGLSRTKEIKAAKIKSNVKKSLIAKNFRKGILSTFIVSPRGFLEPFSCKKKMWIITIPASRKGIKKCNIKKRVKVPCPIEKPPHSHNTMFPPTKGMADARLVITVAPQYDIWPQGNT